MRNFIHDRALQQGIEQGMQQGIAQGMQQGMQQGRVEVARALLLETLRTRSLRLGPAQRARIERESHEDVLMQWFRRALLAQRAAELFVESA